MDGRDDRRDTGVCSCKEISGTTHVCEHCITKKDKERVELELNFKRLKEKNMEDKAIELLKISKIKQDWTRLTDAAEKKYSKDAARRGMKAVELHAQLFGESLNMKSEWEILLLDEKVHWMENAEFADITVVEKKGMSAEEGYAKWKEFPLPIMYNWISSSTLEWPSDSCCWGPVLDTDSNIHRLYYNKNIGDSWDSWEGLIVATAEVGKSDAEFYHVSENQSYVKTEKEIQQPRAIKKIMALPDTTKVATLQSEYVHIWDVKSQLSLDWTPMPEPEMELTGHKDNAEYALATCSTEPFVLCGGRNKQVVSWNLEDYQGRQKVDPKGLYTGPTNYVYDLKFCPVSANQFCGVGADGRLILWDARVGYNPTMAEKAHDHFIHGVDWSGDFILTGSADKTARVFDCRKLGSPVYTFEGHNAAIFHVQWCPDKPLVFGSSSADGIINIWDCEKADVISPSADPIGQLVTSRGLIFCHRGHRRMVRDFRWNPNNVWTIVSVSDDSEVKKNNTGIPMINKYKKSYRGTLQIWRVDKPYRE